MNIKKIIFSAKTKQSEIIEIELTEEELDKIRNSEEKIKNEQRISELKQKLSGSDYQAIKYAEGQLTAEEYAETKAQRQEWRDEINSLEV